MERLGFHSLATSPSSRFFKRAHSAPENSAMANACNTAVSPDYSGIRRAV
jgi:hypothetical protein